MASRIDRKTVFQTDDLKSEFCHYVKFKYLISVFQSYVLLMGGTLYVLMGYVPLIQKECIYPNVEIKVIYIYKK